MNRPFSSIALASFLGFVVTACGAAPAAERDGDGTGGTTQADSVSGADCPPFTRAATRQGMVCTQSDPEDGTRKARCVPGLVTYCATETFPVVPPAGGYPGGTPASCSDFGGTPVDPPPILSGCTKGYQFTVFGSGYLNQAFLCPSAIVTQARAGSLTVPDAGCRQTSIAALTPANGCFGAPFVDWGYVEVSINQLPFGGNEIGPHPPGSTPVCGIPTECGAACMVSLGRTDPSLIDPAPIGLTP